MSALANRRVLVTGHTGFKGSWLTWWLHRAGAHVTGFALEPEPRSMYRLLRLGDVCDSVIGDVRDRDAVAAAVERAKPDFVFHLAAQPLVLASYDDPLRTITTNVTGTANVLDVLRTAARPVVAIVVTSDKCYENDGTTFSFAEDDRLGGSDVYSMSKAAAELVTASYRRSFFAGSGIRVATARAGNVIGGGDYAANRIVPDCIDALASGQPIRIRNPRAVRPWQHVLEPVAAYVRLAERLADDASVAEAWNFGPAEEDACSVAELVDRVIRAWGSGDAIVDERGGPHEAAVLRLSTNKAANRLGWAPRWRLPAAIEKAVEWYKAERSGADADALRALTSRQVEAYMGADESGR